VWYYRYVPPYPASILKSHFKKLSLYLTKIHSSKHPTLYFDDRPEMIKEMIQVSIYLRKYKPGASGSHL
jgi:hypothetical protein